MLKRLLASIAVALGAANVATAIYKLPVLGWFASRRRDGLAGAMLFMLGIMARPFWWIVPIFVPLQILAASIRGFLKHESLFDQAQTVQIMHDDHRVPALLFMPDQPTNAAVLFVHGAGNSKTRYSHRPIISLRHAGFAVLAIDLDGHGDNQRLFDVATVGDGVVAAVAWLYERYDRVAIYGVSLGGAVAARTVAHGVRVDALAIIEAPHQLDLAARPYQWSEFWALWRPAFWRSHDGVTPMQLAQQWNAKPIRSKRPLKHIFDELNVCEAIQHITIPTLLLYSTDDWVAQFAPILHCLPSSSQITMHLYSGMAHLGVTMEQEPLDDAATWLKVILANRHEREGNEN